MTSQKILIIDDEDMITGLCKKVLEKEGYRVVTSSGGKDALKIASKEYFHMVLTDMKMPEMDGLETFLELKKQQNSLIGVLMTAHGTMDTAIEAMSLGFSSFIRKPFLSEELTHVVKDAFQKAALIEENTRIRTLIPLYSLGEKFISSSSQKHVLDAFIDAVSRQMNVQRISVMLYDDTENCLKIAASKGMNLNIASKVKIKPGSKIAGRVFQTGKAKIINGGPEDNPKLSQLLKSKDIIAAICYPLKTRDKILGVLNISRTGKRNFFSEADIEMLSVICSQAVMALENIRVMEERAEKVRLRTVFEQYVAPEVAEALISQGKDPLSMGEIRKITVLFADMRNFTPLVLRLRLETLRSFLNDFFRLLSDIVFNFKGALDKFMGDAVLAYFGSHIPLDLPENVAVLAGITMQKRFQKLKESWEVKNPPIGKIGLGIGISSGKMFLGNVGSSKRFDYTVIGKDVNISQRLASAAASGQILITENVHSQIDPKFNAIEDKFRLLKGLDDPIPIYSIIA